VKEDVVTIASRSTRALSIAATLATATVLLSGCGPTSADEAASSAATASALALQTDLRTLADSGVNVSVPDAVTLAVLYGVDGGMACVNAASERLVTFNGVHFGSASGRRPGIVDPAAIAYDEAVLKTYCPDELATYQAAIEGWTTAGTLPGSNG
jgi:hypothetical protein